MFTNRLEIITVKQIISVPILSITVGRLWLTSYGEVWSFFLWPKNPLKQIIKRFSQNKEVNNVQLKENIIAFDDLG